jgi:hypothetical protein
MLDTNAKGDGTGVYNRPVAPAAVDYLLAALPAIDSAPILNRECTLPAEGGKFYLHPTDCDFSPNSLGEKMLNEIE